MVLVPVVLGLVGVVLVVNMWKTNKLNQTITEEVQRTEEETRLAYEHQQTCKTEIKDIQDSTNEAKKEAAQLKIEVEKASEETLTLEGEVESLDESLEYEDELENELSKNNTRLGRELRNKVYEITYFQCQLDLLKLQERAITEGNKAEDINSEEKCKLEIEKEPEEDYDDEEGSGEEDGSGDEYYDEEEDSEEYTP